MISCDYLIIGMGIAGIGLKYKLKGNVILIEKKPFSYKIGESHIPNLLDADIGFLKLAPKLKKEVKSYQFKKGTIFSDSRGKKYKKMVYTELKDKYTFHGSRIDLEKFIVKELEIDYIEENVLDVDLKNKIVKTNLNTYKVDKYILDCSGPRMFIADKLGMINNVYDNNSLYAVWGYWNVDEIDNSELKVDEYTLLNQIDDDKWIWQIPLYGGKCISVGIISTKNFLDKKEYKEIIEEYKHPFYKNISLQNKELHYKTNFSKIAEKASGEGYILVGDAYCFADPIYSVGTGVSISESIYLAKQLNNDKFNSDEYNKKCHGMIKQFLGFFSSWYDDSWKNIYNLEKIQKNVLQGDLINKEFDTYVDIIKKYSLTVSNVESLYGGNQERIFDGKGSLLLYFSHEFMKMDEDKLKIGFFGLGSSSYEEVTNKNVIEVFSSLKEEILGIKEVMLFGKNRLSSEDYKNFYKILIKLYKKRLIPIYFNNEDI